MRHSLNGFSLSAVVMSDELEKDKTAEMLHAAMRSETAPDEKIIWMGRPDTDAMALPLLPFPICWLSGLFMLCAGILRSADGDTTRMLPSMIVLLVIAAVMGMLEVIAVPWQAKRSIYVFTDRRTFVVKLRGRFGDPEMTNYNHVSKKLVRPEKATILNYYCYNVPIQLLFLFVCFDLVTSVASHSDIFIVIGAALIIAGWLYQWYADLRYPLPQLRECPRAFYFINEWLATIENIPHEAVVKTVLHKSKSGLGDIFIIAKTKGCMRLKAIPNAQEAYAALRGLLPGKST